MYTFVVNVRDGGRCHLASPAAMAQPKQKRRSLCGWRFTSAASLATTNACVKLGKLCQKYFPVGIAQREDGNVSPIEDCE